MAFGWFKRQAPPPSAAPAGGPSGAYSGAHSGAYTNLDRLRAEVKQRDEDRRLTLEILRLLKPGRAPKAMAEEIMDACRGPFGLTTFYLALVDYDADRLTFPLYYEGGKSRVVAPRVYSQFNGLTRRILMEGRSAYFPTKALQEEAGVSYTEAERLTGLIPESWFGVPLGAGPGWPDRPFGALSFQSFTQDAFPPARRQIMEALGGALALALKADPSKRLRP